MTADVSASAVTNGHSKGRYLMASIPVAGGLSTIVDDEDQERLSRYSWCMSHVGYAVGKVGGKLVYMHRMIMDAQSGQQVDHANRNKLDNRRSNLRFCTNSQNTINRTATNPTGYRGVQQRSQSSWAAKVECDSVPYYLGIFPTPYLAAYAYDVAARILHGEFAQTNFEEELAPTIKTRRYCVYNPTTGLFDVIEDGAVVRQVKSYLDMEASRG